MALQTKNVKGQLAISAAALLTVTENQTWIIRNITVSNNSGAAVANIKFFIYPNGGSASDATQFHNIGSLADDQQRQIPLNHNLNSLDVLAGVAASATDINYIISYSERTD